MERHIRKEKVNKEGIGNTWARRICKQKRMQKRERERVRDKRGEERKRERDSERERERKKKKAYVPFTNWQAFQNASKQKVCMHNYVLSLIGTCCFETFISFNLEKPIYLNES